MAFKSIIAGVAAVSLAVTPTLAAAQAAPTAAPAQLAPGEETVEGSELRGGFVIPVIVIIAIILGILAYTNDGDRLPPSP